MSSIAIKMIFLCLIDQNGDGVREHVLMVVRNSEAVKLNDPPPAN
jgi:hypothetical protein